MNKEQPNYYAILTADVRYDKELSSSIKLFYAEITALCGKSGKCWASNKYFAELFNVSTSSITKWISKLVEKGYIKSEIIYKENTKQIEKRYLTLACKEDKKEIKNELDPIVKNYYTPSKNFSEGIVKKSDTPIVKNYEDNNTRLEYYKKNKKKESVRSKLAYEDLELQNKNHRLEEKNKIIQTQQKNSSLEDFKNKFLQIQEKANNQKSANQDLHPQDIIKAYKELISQKYEDITEIKSFNAILIHHEHLEAMLKGIKNYAKVLKLKQKKPEKLFFFIRDKIYLDYQNEQVVELGKNEAIVPTQLVGVEFRFDGEQMKFLEDGYLKIDKNWKVTNAKDVLHMTQIVQKSINQKIRA